MIIALITGVICSGLAQYFIHRFSRMALLENQMEVYLIQDRISLEYCYRIIDRFQSWRSGPCPSCHQAHTVFDYVSLMTLFKPCISRNFFRILIFEGTIIGIVFLFYLKYKLSILFWVYSFLILFFAIITVVDYRYYIIPDELNFLGVGLGLLTHGVIQLLIYYSDLEIKYPTLFQGVQNFSIFESILGLLMGAGILFCIAYLTSLYLGRDSMGGGDIKLTAFIGAFLGYKATLLALALSSVLGSVFGIATIIKSRYIEKNEGYTMIAYGPYIILATLIVMYFGADSLIHSYEVYSMEFVEKYMRSNH